MFQLLRKQLADGVQEQLLVSDAKLGSAIKEKLDVSVVSNNAVNELMRCIRLQTESLISGLTKKDITAMELGLAHRYSLICTTWIRMKRLISLCTGHMT